MTPSSCFGGVMLEDVRFATRDQIQTYSAEERATLPHIPGFQLTQLVDQVAEFQRLNPNTRAMVVGPLGTVTFMARYLTEQLTTAAVFGRIASAAADHPLLRKLELLPKFTFTVSNELAAEARDRIDLWCLLGENVRGWVDYLTQARLLFPGSRVIGYDAAQSLADLQPPGHYFMHSRVWVRDHAAA